jgi:transcriptional regulator with XRE-family HTH domain
MSDTKINVKETLAKAKLTADDIAQILGVSRTMVYRWMGGADIGPKRIARVTKVMMGLELAVAAGDLPLAEDLTARSTRIKKALVTNLR